MMYSIPLFPDHTLYLLLLTGLSAEKMAELFGSELRGSAALLDPALTPSPRCVASAVSKALLSCAARGRALSGTVHGEVCRALLGGKSSSDAARLLGSPRGDAAVVALVDAPQRTGSTGLAASAVLAERFACRAIEWVPAFDAAAVAAAWKIPAAELSLGADGCAIGALEAAVLVRIGCGSDVS